MTNAPAAEPSGSCFGQACGQHGMLAGSCRGQAGEGLLLWRDEKNVEVVLHDRTRPQPKFVLPQPESQVFAIWRLGGPDLGTHRKGITLTIPNPLQ